MDELEKKIELLEKRVEELEKIVSSSIAKTFDSRARRNGFSC